MGYTKGPWMVDANFPSDVKSLKKMIVIQSDDINTDDTETLANAALIAAAPEMLETLEETLSCIDQHTDDPVIGPIIEQAKQVIKKAKGK